MHRFFLTMIRRQKSLNRAELFVTKDRLTKKLNTRSQLQRALLDDDPAMFTFLLIVFIIFTIELTANLSDFAGWASWLHLIVVGGLQLAIIYLLASAVRAAFLRRRLRRIDNALRTIACPPPLTSNPALNHR